MSPSLTTLCTVYRCGYETTLTTFLSAFGTKDGERIEGAADLNVSTTICFPNEQGYPLLCCILAALYSSNFGTGALKSLIILNMMTTKLYSVHDNSLYLFESS